MNIHDELGEFDRFDSLKIQFLNRICEAHLPADIGGPRPSLIIVTHLLPDRPALLTAFRRHFEINHVFGIPYSTDPSVAKWVARHFHMSEPKLSELVGGACIRRALNASSGKKIILLDIGGYAAQIVNKVHEELGERFYGVVEGTQSGFLKYSATAPHRFPVVCMSLSPIKAAESAVVGPACLFSVDRILRSLGFANEIKTVVVLGYGRIGKSVAEACRARQFTVYVFDQEPERRIQALADGFLIPDRHVALAKADLVLGTTGQQSWHEEDVEFMRDGTFFASCSSKDVEFNFASIRERHSVEQLGACVHTATIHRKRLHFIYEGCPVNFSDGANLGFILSLIQAETIAVCGDLLRQRFARGIQEPEGKMRKIVIKEWLNHYLDKNLGWYKRRSAT